MEINLEQIRCLQIDNDWFHEVTKYGEYVAFNGSEEFKEIVKKICIDPENHIISNKFDESEIEIFSNFRALKASFRTASNGKQYDWYIKYFNLEDNFDFENLHIKIFDLAVIFNALINEGLFKANEILESIPNLKKDYTFEFLDEHTLIKVLKNNPKERENTSSLELNGLKNEMEGIKNILASMQQPDSASIDKLKDKINELEKDLKSTNKGYEELNKEYEGLEEEILECQKENGRLRSYLNENNAASITFFKSVFPQFSVLSESFIPLIMNSKTHLLYVNKIKDVYKQLIDEKRDIKSIENCSKIENLNYWYKILITKKDFNQTSSGYSSDIYADWKWEGGLEALWTNKTIGNLYICSFEEFGNQNIYLHAGDESKLENHDPPRKDSGL